MGDQLRLDSIMPVSDRPQADWEATAEFIHRYIGRLPEDLRDEAWEEIGGGLLGKHWPRWRVKVEKK